MIIPVARAVPFPHHRMAIVKITDALLVRRLYFGAGNFLYHMLSIYNRTIWRFPSQLFYHALKPPARLSGLYKSCRDLNYFISSMKWIVKKSSLSGTITVPPSKSHTIRAIVIATLAQGRSHLKNVLVEGDGGSALNAAKCFGAKVKQNNAEIIIDGVGGDYSAGQTDFFMGNSGTSTNLFTSVCALGARQRRIDGDSSVRSRPVNPLHKALMQLGAAIVCENPPHDVPFTIQGPIRGGQTEVDGISSQFVSSLLLSLPLCKGPSTVLVKNLHEKPYVEITLWWLDKTNVSYKVSGDLSCFKIRGNHTYQPITTSIPGDFSSAVFPLVGASLAGETVTIQGIDFSDPQGDKQIFTVVEALGASLSRTQISVTITGGNPLSGRRIDLNASPDSLCALAVLGCAASGETQIVNVPQARIKETDRITVMAQELSKMGARIQELPDGLIIKNSVLHGAQVNGHHDHRVVMALALAGMIAEGETIIDTAESAAVTYPAFVKDFKALGADIKVLAD
jgi:3-phosphoshikimate 1-carboxyvinyltransferase